MQFRTANGSTKRNKIRGGITLIGIHAGETHNAADLAERLELAEVCVCVKKEKRNTTQNGVNYSSFIAAAGED